MAGTVAGVLSIHERDQRRQLRAVVAPSTVDVLADRVVRLLSQNRRMTLVRHYLGSDRPTILPGLILDPESGTGPISRFAHPHGVGIDVHLAPGLHRFGFSADPHAGDEETQQRRLRSAEPSSVTEVEIIGGTRDGGAGAEDRIEITHYNSNGVGERTTIAFDLLPASDQAEVDARLIDTLAGHARATGVPFDADRLDAIAGHLRYCWSTVAEACTATTSDRADTGT